LSDDYTGGLKNALATIAANRPTSGPNVIPLYMTVM
jgi:hypothetical protein